MSATVIRQPKDNRHEWCEGICNITGGRFTFGKDISNRKYPVNTVLRCDRCSRLWVVKRSLANMMIWEPYYVVRPLRWYHRAGWGLHERQEA